MPTRLGCVQYLNTLPLIEGLDCCADLQLIPAPPSRLAPMLIAGEVDLALASVADFARYPGRLCLVPAGMIGSDGPTLTVRLYSSIPFEQVSTLHADAESHTSVVLAQLVLAARFGRSVTVTPFDAAGRADADPWPDTFLLIGDKVVSAAPPATRCPHSLDLGEAWKAWTGLPFMYACWMCRAGEADSPAITLAAATLDRQRRRNASRLDWLVNKHAAQRAWPADLARRYVRDLLTYQVTDAARAGAERFLAEAARAGLLPACTPRWSDLAIA